MIEDPGFAGEGHGQVFGVWTVPVAGGGNRPSGRGGCPGACVVIGAILSRHNPDTLVLQCSIEHGGSALLGAHSGPQDQIRVSGTPYLGRYNCDPAYLGQQACSVERRQLTG